PRTLIRFGAGLGFAVVALFGFLVYILFAEGDPDHWSGEIAEFTRQDISNPPPKGALLFVGGSDLRQWESLSQDMAPLKVINRGFGGARISHITHYASRIIKPYAPQAIVVMAGDEDLADVRGYRPEDLQRDLDIFVAAVRAHGVKAPVIFVSVRPSPMRKARWLASKRANVLIRELADAHAGVYYIDVASSLFNEDQSLRADMFRWDGLSLTEEGYAQIREMLYPALMGAFGVPVNAEGKAKPAS
ncbi:MAG: hypothetical protein KUG59_02120, partial [Parvibaculaceae bacterium]|nr:hypothetical protein [Parvibaculaceae bacterium]